MYFSLLVYPSIPVHLSDPNPKYQTKGPPSYYHDVPNQYPFPAKVYTNWILGYYLPPILSRQHRAPYTDLLLSHIRENRSEEHTSELQSRENLVCRLLLEKKNKKT